jgi:hypothetical protein
VVQVDYEVNRPARDCTVWLALENSDGVMVFTVADHDQDTSMLEQRLPGYYRSRIEIHAKWLNAGRYSVIVGIVQNSPLFVFDREEAVSFTVLDIGSPGTVHHSGGRRGVLQPILPWGCGSRVAGGGDPDADSGMRDA